MDRASSHPVFGLMMVFLQDSGMVDYILANYENHEIVRLRELRSISSFVENLKKSNQANPGIMADGYVLALDQLEKHSIALRGEMVSSAQEGAHILTAHGSKGLEFKHVFIPFCIQDKSWPKREQTNKIPLPHELLIGQEKITDKEAEKRLHNDDENRLFYVAATRAKDRLVFTAAPQDKQVFSQFLNTLGLAPERSTPISEEETLIQLLKKSPQPDPVEFSRDTLQGLVEDISLSPSSVNRYLKCHREFLYHNLLKAPQPKTQALIYGQCVHKALEKSFRRYMNEGQLPPLKYFEEQFFQELDWHGVDQAIRKGCEDKL
ncbi:MAG: 3'-5' exonuclease, partial [Candidatus Gracilibacteria bacterium]|nr:3'-5' exonuclease [Candidatus Gracilibacteria bacterium]